MKVEKKSKAKQYEDKYIWNKKGSVASGKEGQ